MNVRRSDTFISDIEGQVEWYAVHADWNIAERYLVAVEETCRLLEQHPKLGCIGRFVHPKLKRWRFFVISRPFSKHIIFYELEKDELILRRVMHGHRDLPNRLLEPPTTQ